MSVDKKKTKKVTVTVQQKKSLSPVRSKVLFSATMSTEVAALATMQPYCVASVLLVCC